MSAIIEKPFVSIILNCYNSSIFLKETLDSIITQTYKNFEVIFWDNISTDNSADIFRSYNDTRFKYFLATFHTNLGEARNLAAKHVIGEWMCFLDCDDIWLPEKLESQINIINEGSNEFGLIYGPVLLKVENGRDVRQVSKKKLPEGDIFDKLLNDNFVSLPSALFKSKLYWVNGGIDSKLKQVEDYDLFLKIAKVTKARVVNKKLCIYRLHNSNLSIKQNELNFLESIYIINKYLPGRNASIGLRTWNSAYALHLFKNKYYIKGIYILFLKGSLYFFCTHIIKILTSKKVINEYK